MGESKYAMRGTKNKLKIVIFFSLMLVLLLWNTAPFGSIGTINGSSSSSPSGLPADHVVTEVDYTIEDSLDESLPLPEVRLEEPRSERQTLKEEVQSPEEPGLETLREEEEGGIEEDGNLRSKSNVMRMQIFDEIRAQSLDYAAVRESTTRNGNASSSCEGRWVYVYELPSEFNVDLAALCDSLFPAFNLCDFFVDSGIGKPVDTRENGSQIFVPPDRWFNTHQYALELISHARVLCHKCCTPDPERASLFYIPFYGGLDVIRWNFASNATRENHDALSMKLLQWLKN